MNEQAGAALRDIDEALAMLCSLKEGMADINSDFEEMLSRWDGTDNDPADPEQADWDEIYTA